MDEKIYFLANKLKEEMDSDERFKRLKEAEYVLNNDENVIRLAMKKDTINDRYNDLLKIYDESHEEVLKVRKELMDAKKELESHPLTKEYLKAYNEVYLLLYKINEILFKDITRSC